MEIEQKTIFVFLMQLMMQQFGMFGKMKFCVILLYNFLCQSFSYFKSIKEITTTVFI